MTIAFVAPEEPIDGDDDPIIKMSMSAYEARLEQARLEGYDEGYEAAIEYMENQAALEDDEAEFEQDLEQSSEVEELEFDGHNIDDIEEDGGDDR